MWFFEFPCKVDSCQYFSQTFKKIFEPQISDFTRKYRYAQSFWRLLKENHVWFYEKHLRHCKESSLKHCIVLPNDNFLEQEFEKFNRDEVGNKDPLGDDNNGEEKEQKTLSYGDFDHNLVVTNFLLGLRGK